MSVPYTCLTPSLLRTSAKSRAFRCRRENSVIAGLLNTAAPMLPLSSIANLAMFEPAADGAWELSLTIRAQPRTYFRKKSGGRSGR